MVKLTLVDSNVQRDSTSQSITLYTDGACSGNPGPGGWGVVMRTISGQESELSGGEIMTTNNRMELMAAIKGLESLSSSQEVAIYTDSMYLRDGMTKWIIKWKANNWSDAIQRNIKNLDLWQRLNELAQHYTIHWHWVRGHAGHAENERADLLARNAIVQLMMQA